MSTLIFLASYYFFNALVTFLSLQVNLNCRPKAATIECFFLPPPPPPTPHPPSFYSRCYSSSFRHRRRGAMNKSSSLYLEAAAFIDYRRSSCLMDEGVRNSSQYNLDCLSGCQGKDSSTGPLGGEGEVRWEISYRIYIYIYN